MASLASLASLARFERSSELVGECAWHQCCRFQMVFFLKMGQPRSIFLFIFVFQTHITNFTAIMNVKKCPSSTRCRDSNSRPLERESPPITTRPSLRFQMLHRFSFASKKCSVGRGGGGHEVSVLAFCYDDPSLNHAEVYSFFC